MAFGCWCCRWFNALSYVDQVQTFGVRRCWKFTPHFGTESGWSKELFFWLKKPEKGLRILFENRSLSENVHSCQPCCTLKTWTSKDVIVRAAVRNRCWILVEGGPNGAGSQDWAQLKEHGALSVGWYPFGKNEHGRNFLESRWSKIKII